MRQSHVTEPSSYENKTSALRIEAKIRYLADVARAVTGESFTKYLERTLEESYKNVTLRIPSEPEIFLDSAGQWVFEEIDQDEERLANEHMSIANQGGLLWSESEYLRLLMLFKVAPQLVALNDAGLLTHIENRTDLRIKTEHGFKLDREKINNEWEAIKATYANSKKKVA